ncbi:MAG: DUF2442 domain-containing protein [Verrucomicrobia bacterium]|nr:DUF2442 domain-containing protein [Verrucomicrobiota bacterium]
MSDLTTEFIAKEVSIKEGMVELLLIDGSLHAFPVHYYPRLASASPAQLRKVQLRVGGRALRWEEFDEDIWIADAVLQRYPNAGHLTVAESPQQTYPRP